MIITNNNEHRIVVTIDGSDLVWLMENHPIVKKSSKPDVVVVDVTTLVQRYKTVVRDGTKDTIYF